MHSGAGPIYVTWYGELNADAQPDEIPMHKDEEVNILNHDVYTRMEIGDGYTRALQVKMGEFCIAEGRSGVVAIYYKFEMGGGVLVIGGTQYSLKLRTLVFYNNGVIRALTEKVQSNKKMGELVLTSAPSDSNYVIGIYCNTRNVNAKRPCRDDGVTKIEIIQYPKFADMLNVQKWVDTVQLNPDQSFFRPAASVKVFGYDLKVGSKILFPPGSIIFNHTMRKMEFENEGNLITAIYAGVSEASQEVAVVVYFTGLNKSSFYEQGSSLVLNTRTGFDRFKYTSDDKPEIVYIA